MQRIDALYAALPSTAEKLLAVLRREGHLHGLAMARPDQAYSTDITYLRVGRSLSCQVAAID